MRPLPEPQPSPAVEGLSAGDYAALRAWLKRETGVELGERKQDLVRSRLARRLAHHGLADFAAYRALLVDGRGSEADAERRTALDLLTTHETSFFREPQHFAHLTEVVLPAVPADRPLRVWSAACSSGEEPWSIAMVLAHHRSPAPWTVLASDVSEGVLREAARGLYPMERARGIPPELLRAHCLRGVRSQSGRLLVDPALRAQVEFRSINLAAALPRLPEFDVVFLRNVMIYFDAATKGQVVRRLAACLRPGGWLYIGHSESLVGLDVPLLPERPAVHRAPGRPTPLPQDSGRDAA